MTKDNLMKANPSETLDEYVKRIRAEEILAEWRKPCHPVDKALLKTLINNPANPLYSLVCGIP